MPLSASHLKKSAGRNSSGFTLVELLVVIGIIAILAVIAMPAYRGVVTAAQKAKCTSNLRSIGVSVVTFASDHNSQYPQTSSSVPLLYGSVGTDTGQPGWTEQLDPYDGGNRQIFRCPSATGQSAKALSNYYLSAWAARYSNGMQFPTPSVKIPRMLNQAVMILAGECTWGNNNSDDDPDDAGVTNTSNVPFNGKPWHGAYYNFVFVDGHVQSVTAFDKTSMTNRYEGLGYDYSSENPSPP